MPTTPRAPGRIGDPNMSLKTEPRLHPKSLAAFAAIGMDGNSPDPPVGTDASQEVLGKYFQTTHEGTEGLYKIVSKDIPPRNDLATSTQIIDGPDGNQISLYIYRPKDTTGPLPCVVYTHGGGMVFMNTTNGLHTNWVESIAAAGCVAINVDFRNAWTEKAWNPFPAGLNDCVAAVQWIHANKATLGINKIVLQGESGGANLAIATALRANREGWVDKINGVYAYAPYISGKYGESDEQKLAELPSLIECDGYFLNMKGSAVFVVGYDPEGKNAKNPLAWPYFAEEKDLKGLPPFIVSVDELDPLRDEGMAFYRKLTKAGVSAVGRVNLGLTHAGSLAANISLPEVFGAIVGDIKRFADSL